jgi:hypothetical protein
MGHAGTQRFAGEGAPEFVVEVGSGEVLAASDQGNIDAVVHGVASFSVTGVKLMTVTCDLSRGFAGNGGPLGRPANGV